ncbi:MAG: hypothetical protein ACE5JH_05630 [Acidobacteriota bacterium]
MRQMGLSVEHPEPEVRSGGAGLRDAADIEPDEAYFARLRSGFGACGVSLSIGPVGMRLEGLSREQAAWMADVYRPFVIDAAESPDMTITLHPAGVDAFLRLPADGSAEIYRMGRRARGSRLHLWSYEFAGRVDSEPRRAALALVSSAGPLFERGLENFLRVLTASIVVERGGFLLHGSGVVRRRRAYVFFGPSGSGKTTVTHLCPHDTILSDDLTLVVPHDGAYVAAGIPFGMAFHRVPETRACFPIASLNRLVKSERVARERLTGARALAEVAGCLPFVMQEPQRAARALAAAGRALREVPVYRLRFRRDDSFWSVVQES